jgi:DNA-binding response OmpR family regulator
MRILLAEDEKELRQFIKSSLESACYAVDAAEDGERAMSLARSNNYDLIILDNIMPKQTGREICQELRQEGADTLILMLSIQSEVINKVDLLDLGADDYLGKPFSLDELHARIRALLRRPKTYVSDIMKFDDLIFDQKRHKVIRDDVEIYLTKKEFMLLEYLLRNQGNVLSRAKIIEHVWDMNADPFSNTVESHIVSLRRKIDLDGRRKLIQTIPGRGYKIE